MLQRGGKDGAPGSNQRQARQVVLLLCKLIEKRPRKRISNDRDGVHTFALHRRPNVVGIESLNFRLDHHRGADVPHIERNPVCGAVHQRRRRQGTKGSARFNPFQKLLEGLGDATRSKRAFVNVLVAPDHALGHPGRSAGVQDVEIVVRERRRQGLWSRGRECFLIVDGSRQQGIARFVRNLKPEFYARKLITKFLEHGGKGCVIDNRFGLRVFEEIQKFFFDVAIIDVERYAAGLECPQHAFEILIAVIEIQADVILARLPVGQHIAFGVTPQAGGVEHGCETPSAVGDFAPRKAAIAEDDALVVREYLGDRFVESGQVVHDAGYASPVAMLLAQR